MCAARPRAGQSVRLRRAHVQQAARSPPICSTDSLAGSPRGRLQTARRVPGDRPVGQCQLLSCGFTRQPAYARTGRDASADPAHGALGAGTWPRLRGPERRAGARRKRNRFKRPHAPQSAHSSAASSAQASLHTCPQRQAAHAVTPQSPAIAAPACRSQQRCESSAADRLPMPAQMALMRVCHTRRCALPPETRRACLPP